MCFHEVVNIDSTIYICQGHGVSALWVSKLLYAAEFFGVIPELFAVRLHVSEVKLVDRGLAPVSHEHRLAGLASHLLGRQASRGLMWCVVVGGSYQS